MTDEKTLLLDATNLGVRCWHAAERTSMYVDGMATGPLVLFVNSMSKFTGEEKPTRFVACWDEGGSTYREKLYPAYKLARRQALHQGNAVGPALLLIMEFLELSGIAQWSHAGVEADDLIAAAHRRTAGPKVILSSDKDLLQLVDEQTSQIRFSGAVKPDRWDLSRVYREYGGTEAKLAMMMALAGDASDGVPGLPGIGMRRAYKILKEHDWDWETLVADLSPEQRHIVRLSRSLIDLHYVDTTIPFVPQWEPYPSFGNEGVDVARTEALRKFCDKWQLSNIWHRIETRTLWL